MHFIENFYIKTLKYDLSNKFLYNNIKKLPKLEKIIINIGCKTTDMKLLGSSLLSLELITTKRGTLTSTKQANVSLKIRKGQPVGCKVILRKQHMFNFLERTLIEILPKLRDFNGLLLSRKIKKNIFSYELHDTFTFNELEEQYYLFNNLPKLNITIVTNANIKEELFFILKSFQFPFYYK